MKFLVFNNKINAGLGTGDKTILNWDSVKYIDPNTSVSSNTFKIELNNGDFMSFSTNGTNAVGLAIKEINRVVKANPNSRILEIKPKLLTNGQFSFRFLDITYTSSGAASKFDESFLNVTTSSSPNNLIGKNIVSPDSHPFLGRMPVNTLVLGTDIGNNSAGDNGLGGKFTSKNVLIGKEILNNISTSQSFSFSSAQENTIIGNEIFNNFTHVDALFASGSILIGHDVYSGSISGSGSNAVSNSVVMGYEINTNVSGNVSSSVRNVIIGSEIESMGTSTGGFDDQVVIGGRACQNNGASQITVIGALAAGSNNVGGNCTVIGYNAQPSINGVQNEITLGNSSVTTLRCATATITTISDERDKTDIENLPHGLDLINSLQPRKFVWDVRDETIIQKNKETNPETGEITVTEEEVVVHNAKNGTKDIGFIAQELQTVDNDFLKLVHDANPDKLEASYSRLIPVLVKAIQELSAKVTTLENA